ncbi:MAG: class I SAM-dependent methyltransferase [Opitutaceae bacterium]
MFTQTDWYRFPLYYDIVFDNDTGREADFLEAVWERHGPRLRKGASAAACIRVLEPACGNGRLVFELARRGHRVAGFDASAEMIAYAGERVRTLPAGACRRVRLREDRMESFRMRGPFDLAHCLLSTFKYLLKEEDAVAHLRRVARALARGGLYVIGIHLTDYARRRTDREIWKGQRDSLRVTSEVITRPADAATRLEWLRNRMHIRRRGVREVEKLETHWQCRTYNAAEFEAIIAKAPLFEVIACYDFAHDIDSPRGLDDTQEDLIVVLRRRA